LAQAIGGERSTLAIISRDEAHKLIDSKPESMITVGTPAR
jgi:hypothetical protein